mgnify:CR=1 FL=1
MLLILIAAAAGTLAGAIAGGFLSWRLLRRHSRSRAVIDSTEPPLDPRVSAEIDQAAATWAAENNRGDQAAGLLADKLRLLHRLGTERRP